MKSPFWLGVGIVFSIAAAVCYLMACSPFGDTTPTRIVCFAGNTDHPIFDATVPAKDASLCKWDWGHNGVCVRLGESQLAFGPAHPCTMQRNPPKPPAPPQPSATTVPTVAAQPTASPGARRK